MARSNIKYTNQHRVYANEFVESSSPVSTQLPFTADTTYKVRVYSITEGASNIKYNNSTGAFSCYEIREGLPSGYTELEYIESTGTQWINTGINQRYDGPSIHIVATMCLTQNTSTGAYHFGNAFTQFNAYGYATQNVRNNVDIVWNTSTHYETITVNGTQKENKSWTNSYDNISIYLFNLGSGNGTTYYNPPANSRYYSCQIYLDGALVRNFIPAKNSSNVAGMYDCCTATFYTNSNGSTNFTAGPAI